MQTLTWMQTSVHQDITVYCIPASTPNMFYQIVTNSPLFASFACTEGALTSASRSSVRATRLRFSQLLLCGIADKMGIPEVKNGHWTLNGQSVSCWHSPPWSSSQIPLGGQTLPWKLMEKHKFSDILIIENWKWWILHRREGYMGISHTEVVNSKVVDFIHGDPIKLNSKSLKVDVSSISRSAENRCHGANFMKLQDCEVYSSAQRGRPQKTQWLWDKLADNRLISSFRSEAPAQ